MPVTTFNPPNVPVPPPTYNQVAITPISATSKLVTLAGQVGIDARTGKVATTIDEQVRLAYTNVQNALSAAGAGLRDIIHVRHYIVKDTGDAAVDAVDVLHRGWGKLWAELLDSQADGHRPPDTVLGVASLATKELLYEIEVWAIVSSA